MKRIRRLVGLVVVLGLVLPLGGMVSWANASDDSVRISVGELKQMLGMQDLVIVDVRDPISWSKSEGKIPGALREDPETVGSWAGTLSRDKTIVLYCS